MFFLTDSIAYYIVNLTHDGRMVGKDKNVTEKLMTKVVAISSP